MAASFASILLDSAIEHVSKVWVELVLALCAAVFYLVFSQKNSKAKRPKKSTSSYGHVTSSEEQCGAGQFPEQELTTAQLAVKAMR